MPSGLTMLTSQPTITIAAPNATFRSFLLNFAQISPTRHDLLDCVRRRLPLGAAPRQGTRAGNPRTVVPVHRRTADTRPVSTPRAGDPATSARVAEPQTRWGGIVLDRLPLDGDEMVLDAGCGSGR